MRIKIDTPEFKALHNLLDNDISSLVFISCDGLEKLQELYHDDEIGYYAPEDYDEGIILADYIMREFIKKAQPKSGKTEFGDGKTLGDALAFLDLTVNDVVEVLSDIYDPHGKISPAVCIPCDVFEAFMCLPIESGIWDVENYITDEGLEAHDDRWWADYVPNYDYIPAEYRD